MSPHSESLCDKAGTLGAVSVAAARAATAGAVDVAASIDAAESRPVLVEAVVVDAATEGRSGGSS
jgi:hypothetical protein